MWRLNTGRYTSVHGFCFFQLFLMVGILLTQPLHTLCYFSELGSLTHSELMQKVRTLQKLAYQLGVEEGEAFTHTGYCHCTCIQELMSTGPITERCCVPSVVKWHHGYSDMMAPALYMACATIHSYFTPPNLCTHTQCSPSAKQMSRGKCLNVFETPQDRTENRKPKQSSRLRPLQQSCLFVFSVWLECRMTVLSLAVKYLYCDVWIQGVCVV